MNEVWAIKVRQRSYRNGQLVYDGDWMYHYSNGSNSAAPSVYLTKGKAEGAMKRAYSNKAIEEGNVKVVKWEINEVEE